MRPDLVAAALVLASFLPAVGAAPAAGPSVVVQPPAASGDVDEGVAEALGEIFSARIEGANVFSNVVSMRDVVDMLRHEQNRQLLGCESSSESCLAEIGGALGASHLALLDVRRLGQSHVLTAKLLELGSAKVLYRQSKTIVTLDAAQPVVEELAQKLATRVLVGGSGGDEALPLLAERAREAAARPEAAQAALQARERAARVEEERRRALGTQVEAGMVLVPAGPFLFGCNVQVDRECGESEKPGRRVELPAFAIDRTEVTYAEYEQCVDAGACTPASDDWYGCVWGAWFSGSDPINCVDQQQATAFCAWKQKRLPSAREWEKAARGTDGRRFPWGNALDAVPAQLAPASDAPAAVASFPGGASPYGVLDMAGNVAEWTASTYDERRFEYRGGGFLSTPAFARTSDRHRAEAATRKPDLGFRCAR